MHRCSIGDIHSLHSNISMVFRNMRIFRTCGDDVKDISACDLDMTGLSNQALSAEGCIFFTSLRDDLPTCKV